MGETPTFSFGNFIKILFPGLALSSAIYLFVLSDGRTSSNAASPMLPFEGASSVELFAFVIVPLSVFCGLVINAIVFVLLNKLFIRAPHRAFSRDYYAKAAIVNDKIREYFTRKACSGMNAEGRLKLNAYLDPELLLINRMKQENLAYLQEKYFLYHEVQMNMIAAAIIFLPVFIWSETSGATAGAYVHIGPEWTIAATIVFILIMWWAAYANYDRYLKKTLSLRLSAFDEIYGR